MTDPQYYAHGADVPRALDAIETAQRSTQQLDQELDAHLVGLARLVTDPADRRLLAGAPHITIASDLHNNVLAIPILERAADDGPVLFAGDLTDRGSPLETRLVQRVVDTGHPFVFVSGNHDSDTLQRELARQGAVVLTESGRLNPDGTRGAIVQEVRGSGSPATPTPSSAAAPRTSGTATRTRRPPPCRTRSPSGSEPIRTTSTSSWSTSRPSSPPRSQAEGRAARPPAALRRRPHPPADLTLQPGVTILNGGSVGAGGTGNLGDPDATSIGIARFVFTGSRASSRSRRTWSRSIPSPAPRPRAGSAWTRRTDRHPDP